MKKIKYALAGISLMLMGLPAFAQNQVPGLVSSGQYGQGALGSVAQIRQIQQSPDGEYGVGVYPLNTPELVEGDGREIIQIFCRFCHSVTYITMQPPLPAVIWEGVVNKMIATYGAPISEDSAKQINSYLRAHYTPATRKQ